MANIRDFIEKIGIARYGNDVRSSIMNALMAVNDESEKSVLLVNQSVEKANEASNVALEASNTANDLTSRAEIVIVEAEQSASDAEQSSIQAGEKAELAERNAKISQSYAVGGTGTRENEDIDNAMYYYMQAKHISQGNNGLVPMGTITFEELPISDITQNAMYNISNAFTSDERFLDGGGLNYGAGSNVYYTVNGKWDVLAASSVNGVKGNKESEYRQGNVNITPENIGALPEDGNAVSATKATQDSNGNNIVETYRTKTGDTADNVVSFASGDSVNPTGWEDINVVESGETHGSLFRKISLAIKNLRYLYNMIGTADIAAIGDGTIKGAITGLNNNMGGFTFTTQDTKDGYLKDGEFHPFGNPYLRYDEDTGYVQAMKENGEWTNLLKISSLPIKTYILMFDGEANDTENLFSNKNGSALLRVVNNTYQCYAETQSSFAYIGWRIDLTVYSKVIFYNASLGYSGNNGYSYLGVAKSNALSSISQWVKVVSSANSENIEIDITDLIGVYYVGFMSYSLGGVNTANVQSIILE